MVIRAGTWIGNRTKVWNAYGIPVVNAVALDTRARTAEVLVRDESRRTPSGAFRMVMKDGKPLTETVDARGWTYKLAGVLRLSL